MKKHKLLVISLFSILLVGIIFQTNALLAQVNRGTAVPVETLPNELKGMDIKDYFLSASSKEVGIIHALQRAIYFMRMILLIHLMNPDAGLRCLTMI